MAKSETGTKGKQTGRTQEPMFAKPNLPVLAISRFSMLI